MTNTRSKKSKAAKKTAKIAKVVRSANSIKAKKTTQRPARVDLATAATLKAHNGTDVPKISAKWLSLRNRAEVIKTEPYNMRGTYEIDTAIEHKVMGWGYVLDSRNDRLEVLFKDGIKYLISNYK